MLPDHFSRLSAGEGYYSIFGSRLSSVFQKAREPKKEQQCGCSFEDCRYASLRVLLFRNKDPDGGVAPCTPETGTFLRFLPRPKMSLV